MKELVLPAVMDAGTPDNRLTDPCHWLTVLAGGVDAASRADADRLFHVPRPGVVEVWCREADGAELPEVACYSRLSFRPLPPEGEEGEEAVCRCGVAVELLPPARLYTGRVMAGMGLAGASPRLVAVDGRVVPHASLGCGPQGGLERAYAVLTPALAGRLGVPHRASRLPEDGRGAYAALCGEVERLLGLCFPGGGEAEGCPLHLSLSPRGVEAGRLLRVGEEHRRLSFGASGEGCSAREGFGRHGACRPGRYRTLEVTMLYPQGSLECARRLFVRFVPSASLMGVELLGDVERWVPYEVGASASDVLMQGMYREAVRRVPGRGCLFVLLVPRGGAGDALRGQCLSVRLRMWAASLEGLFWGPVPSDAVEGEEFGRHLPTVAARLLVQMGGVPWVPLRFASQESDLVVGCSHSRPFQSFEPCCAAVFYNDPLEGCHGGLCKPAGRFPLFFPEYFKTAYVRFCAAHANRPPRRLVFYTHADFPVRLLTEFTSWMGRYPAAVPVVWVQVRRTSGADLACYAPGDPYCMPPVGTCLRCGEGRYLLFCRGPVASSSSRGVFCPCPLEVSLHSLHADGRVLPLPEGGAEEVLVQVCQLVWSAPESVDGSALPLVLSHTDRVVRRHCQERELGMADRNARNRGGGGMTF